MNNIMCWTRAGSEACTAESDCSAAAPHFRQGSTTDANRDHMWWYRSVALVPRLLRKLDCLELETSWGYMG